MEGCQYLQFTYKKPWQLPKVDLIVNSSLFHQGLSLSSPICLLQLGNTSKVTAQIQKSVLFINTGPKPLQLTNIASHPFNACIVNNA